MGNDIAQPAWHYSDKLNAELKGFHERVALAAEKSVVGHSGTLKEYLDAIQNKLRHRNVFVFLSLNVISECWREEERRVHELKGDEPVKFEVVCLLDGGNELIAEKPKFTGNTFTSGGVPRFHLKQRSAASGGCMGRLSKSRKQIEPNRELFRQTTLGYLGLISANETRTRFIEHIEGSLKELKLMTDSYKLEHDRSSVRLDVYRKGKVYMTVFLTLHYKVDGCHYIPEPYNSTEPRISWIISSRADDILRLDSANQCQLQVLHLLRTIQRARPELSSLGSRPVTETLLTEIDLTSPKLWTVDDLGSRLLAVLLRLEVGLVTGIISPKVVKNNRQKNMNLLDAISKETLLNAAAFVNRICSNETDFYKEILEPSKSSTTYKYFEKMSLITQPNDLYSV